MADAGYSGTPQARKLGLKPGTRVDVLGAPDGWELQAPPDGIEWSTDAADVILLFVRTRAALEEALPDARRRIHPAGAVWVLWPRRAAGHVSEFTDTIVRETVLAGGLVDVKIAAVDADWSGQKAVWRVVDR